MFYAHTDAASVGFAAGDRGFAAPVFKETHGYDVDMRRDFVS